MRFFRTFPITHYRWRCCLSPGTHWPHSLPQSRWRLWQSRPCQDLHRNVRQSTLHQVAPSVHEIGNVWGPLYRRGEGNSLQCTNGALWYHNETLATHQPQEWCWYGKNSDCRARMRALRKHPLMTYRCWRFQHGKYVRFVLPLPKEEPYISQGYPNISSIWGKSSGFIVAAFPETFQINGVAMNPGTMDILFYGSEVKILGFFWALSLKPTAVKLRINQLILV